MSMIAKTDHPIYNLIAKRWSPYFFDERSVSNKDIQAIFEAARWAPSSYNEQPWSFIVAKKENSDEFETLLSCLVEGNRNWAKSAPVLVLGITKLRFARNNKPNRAALHDLGLASANLSLEATARGLSVHQMIGILPEKARELYEIPDGYKPLTGLAIGYVGSPDALPEEVRERDLVRRPRKPLNEFLFSAKWGSASKLAL